MWILQGIDATVTGRTPWGGGVRTDGHKVPMKCMTPEVPEPEKPVPKEPEEPEDPGKHKD